MNWYCKRIKPQWKFKLQSDFEPRMDSRRHAKDFWCSWIYSQDSIDRRKNYDWKQRGNMTFYSTRKGEYDLRIPLYTCMNNCFDNAINILSILRVPILINLYQYSNPRIGLCDGKQSTRGCQLTANQIPCMKIIFAKMDPKTGSSKRNKLFNEGDQKGIGRN